MNPTEASPSIETDLQPLLAQALERMDVAVMITDVEGRIVWVNDGFSHICGHGKADLIGHTPAILKSGEQNAELYAQLWQTVLSGKVWQGKLVEARKDGSRYTVEETITPLRDEHGVVRHFVAVQHDITQRELDHEQYRFLAQHDVLTGLPNRAMLRDIVQKAISNASRTQQLVAILFVDLDRFKPVNDQFGHVVGDQLLAAAGERLRSALRQSDTVARVGGDEFVALASGIDSRDSASALAKKLLDALAAPFVVRGKKLVIGASLGIAMFPSDGGDGDALIDNADHAMYQAKLEGGQRYQFFGHGIARTEPPASAGAADAVR